MTSLNYRPETGDLAAFQTPEEARKQGYSGPLTQMGGQFVAQEPGWYGGYMNQPPATPQGQQPSFPVLYGPQPPATPQGPQPGAAQPIQPQSQGTPYSFYSRGGGAGNFAYSPQDRGQQPTPPPRSVVGRGGGRQIDSGFNPGAEPRANQFFNDPRGNWAYSRQDQRPQPFTQNTSFGGMSGNAEDVFRQRDAFVQTINNSRSQHAAQWGQGQRQPPPRNFGQMMGQAQGMVKGGWQNPLTGLLGGGGQPQGRFMAPPGYQGAVPSDIAPLPNGDMFLGRSNSAYQGARPQYQPGPNGGAMVGGREVWF